MKKKTMAISIDSYNQTMNYEVAEPLRSADGGDTKPKVLILSYRKSRRAKDKEDYKTWVESDTANTINTFDVGDTRATTIVINEDKDIDREKVL